MNGAAHHPSQSRDTSGVGPLRPAPQGQEDKR